MRRIRWTALALLGALAVTGCAPAQSGTSASSTDTTTGQLRVWLFQEVNQGPEQAVVNAAVKEFEAAHSGVTVDVQYIQVDSRAERFKAAFSDPASAPDVAEFGNTDLAGYVADGGFADLSSDVSSWSEGKDLDPTILNTAKVNGKLYAVPWFVGVRALYYRTDVFSQLGLNPPATLADLAPLARQIHAARPDMLGISVGGKYQYAAMPFIWANGGDLATESSTGTYKAAIDSPLSQTGISEYTSLLGNDICPPSQCAQNGGDASVQAFAAGKAAMTIGGDFNRTAVDAGVVHGKYAVVPLPGTTAGSIAPAFAGGDLLGVTKSTSHRTLAVAFTELLAGKEYQLKMFQAMGNLPTFTDVQAQVAASTPAEAPFIRTLKAGTRFVPSTPAWAKIDAQSIIATMLQQIATGAKSVQQASSAAADSMNAEFGSS